MSSIYLSMLVLYEMIMHSFSYTVFYCYIALGVWRPQRYRHRWPQAGIRSISMALLHRFHFHFRSRRSGTRSSPAPICFNVNGRMKRFNILLRSMVHWVVRCVAFYDAFQWNHSLLLLYCFGSLKTSKASSSMTTGRHQKHFHGLIASFSFSFSFS